MLLRDGFILCSNAADDSQKSIILRSEPAFGLCLVFSALIEPVSRLRRTETLCYGPPVSSLSVQQQTAWSQPKEGKE
jgi:hypothetical protein